jgi:6-phosphogluconolactonase/glucosamine-6-phosphate isomerase/deaminase
MDSPAAPKQIKAKVKRTQRRLGLSPRARRSVRIAEASGIRVSISSDLPHTADHAASVFEKRYNFWQETTRHTAWGQYKRDHFVVAVGGGNTLKAQYQAMIDKLHSRVDWYEHVRFFFLEDSTGEGKWESPEDGLVNYFIAPLARKLIVHKGLRSMVRELGLASSADESDVVTAMTAAMVNPMNLGEVRQALAQKNKALATRRARQEAERYQMDIQHKLGEKMSFHYLLSGIGKDGALGALKPYLPELRETEPGVIVIRRPRGALRIALNRGVIVNAETVSLIVSGTHKLRALGRLEMEETADFEQTVMETPLRMLRASSDTARKVLIFADEQSLHFEETLFQYKENNKTLQNKAETREGAEKDGPHILLMHGFMGLFSFASFLIRLPSAWTVSALHRGSHAKTLPDAEIFPHYARVLRKAILKIWNQGRPVPIAGHSIAGVIMDHLLLSILDNYDAPIKPYKSLKEQDRKLVDALRASGVISLATWAPSDGPHTGVNLRNLIAHYRKREALDYSGFEQTYVESGDKLELQAEAAVSDADSLARLGRFLQTPVAEPIVNGLNRGMRQLLNNKTVQQRMLNINSPYIMRLVGGRLLRTASFYGLFKEVDAALHDPVEYQRRHLRALDIMLEYDIPTLSIIHEDDFLVSARRHAQEHRHLVDRRLAREGVSRERDLQVTTRLVTLKRRADELPVDPLNPHLMIMATSVEGSAMARQVTAAMTRFVNENLEKAIRKRRLKPLASVRKWRAAHPKPRAGR